MKRVYGLVSDAFPDDVRYVGSTRLTPIERLAQHLALARRGEDENGHNIELYAWIRETWLAGANVEYVDLTEVDDVSEKEWVRRLSSAGERLFNIQLTGGHGAVLRRAWKDPDKRESMLQRDETLRIAHTIESRKDDFVREKTRIRRPQSPLSEELKERIRSTLTGRKFGPHDEARRFNQARAVKLWHRQRTMGEGCADVAWLRLLDDVIKTGTVVSPRGQKTLEMRASLVVVDMARPVVTIAERKLGYRFMCAEAAWILGGDDRVETIAPFSRAVSSFSDDGVTFFGAYGPRLMSQLAGAVDSLRSDRESRQAVINIWRENPPKTRDVPCTISCQFMIRDNLLDAFVTMRSSDVWLGICYDIFSFSMFAAYALLELRDKSVRLGSLYHVAASRHLYERDLDGAEECLKEMTIGFRYEPLDVYQFLSTDEFVDHLWALARRDGTAKRRWLAETLA